MTLLLIIIQLGIAVPLILAVIPAVAVTMEAATARLMISHAVEGVDTARRKSPPLPAAKTPAVEIREMISTSKEPPMLMFMDILTPIHLR